MTGDDKIRYCGSCEKDIYNISEMTRGEVRKLLFQSKEKVCIRLEKDADGKVQTLKKRLHKITRQAPVAAGVLSASLTFSALTYAQGEPVVGKVKPNISAVNRDDKTVTVISGIISDQSGAVIPNAVITLRDTKNNLTRNTKSNNEGFYKFENVVKSAYEIEVQASGFRKAVYQNLIVGENKILQLKITLGSSEPTDGDLAANDDRAIEMTEAAQINDKIEQRKIESLPTTQTNRMFLGLTPGIKPAHKKKVVNNQIKTSQITFTIYAPNGDVVPNEKVILTNQKTKEEFTVLTNAQGVAQFSLIPSGRYEVLVSSSIGFSDYRQFFQIKQTIEPNIKITLGIVAVGVFIVNQAEIPLFQAIVQKDNDTVKQLINAGFDVNTKDGYNKTALHIAVEHSNLEIVRFLLDHKAKVNIKSKDKRTPLLMIDESVRDKDDKLVVEIVRLLIAKGADVNVQDDEKETVLMMAGGEGNLEVTKILLDAGANPNLKDKDGDTALSMTSYEEIKRLLLSYGAREN